MRDDVVKGLTRQIEKGIWDSLEEIWRLRPHLTAEERAEVERVWREVME